MTKTDSFDIVAVAREPDWLLTAFVDHCLTLDPGRMTLFLDRDEPWQAPDGVDVIHMTEAWWSARPAELRELAHTGLQRVLYQETLTASNADWLLIVDADEMFASSMPLGELLARVPHDVPSVIFPIAEAVLLDGDDPDAPFEFSGLRMPMSARRRHAWLHYVRWAIYGRTAKLLKPKGTLGPGVGKHAMRTSAAPEPLDIHFAISEGRILSVPAERFLGPREHAVYLHYDAVNFERWRAKWTRRITRKIGTRVQRDMVLEEFIAANDQGEAALRELYRRHHGVTPTQFAILQLMGCARRAEPGGPFRPIGPIETTRSPAQGGQS